MEQQIKADDKGKPMPSSADSSGGECTVSLLEGECLPLRSVCLEISVKELIDLSSDKCNGCVDGQPNGVDEGC